MCTGTLTPITIVIPGLKAGAINIALLTELKIISWQLSKPSLFFGGKGWGSKPIIFCPLNHFLLQIGVHIVEIIAVTSHPNHQVFIIRRTCLRCKQCGCIDNVELNMVASKREITPDQLPELFDVFVFSKQTWQKTLV